ncbi:hypothetical protein GTC3P0254_36570 [Burkholderia pseudomallei]|nr:hypothetical protein GTC019_31000 [Burkholderia pseudomallei]BEH25943.1 hypothetical protein GTC050_31950 [Burkholderia pseudomallei]BEH31971.1 hypothetical protein GTC054_31870 [Burkholderia pseudomallei]BEH37970.1 hypothetical protein GTC254T_30650 [Burkholderia pseudomallei]BEH55888.1 hypothetical protein BpKM376_30670 [Burkholderia pseudomallei]
MWRVMRGLAGARRCSRARYIAAKGAGAPRAARPYMRENDACAPVSRGRRETGTARAAPCRAP